MGLGTSLFDDAIHEYPTNYDKPQLFLQTLFPDTVYIQLTLTAEKWSTYPLRAMMVLYNAVTTNDVSFIGVDTGSMAETSFYIDYDLSG